MEFLVERIEALSEAKGRGYRVSANKRCRPVSVRLEHRREGRGIGTQVEDDVAAHAVRRRILPREDRGVRRPGERRGRLHLVESDAARRQPIERGRLDALRTIGAHVIRTKSVDGDENEVRTRR